MTKQTKAMMKDFGAAMVLMVLTFCFFMGLGLPLCGESPWFFLLSPAAAFCCVLLNDFFDSAFKMKGGANGDK